VEPKAYLAFECRTAARIAASQRPPPNSVRMSALDVTFDARSRVSIGAGCRAVLETASLGANRSTHPRHCARSCARSWTQSTPRRPGCRTAMLPPLRSAFAFPRSTPAVYDIAALATRGRARFADP